MFGYVQFGWLHTIWLDKLDPASSLGLGLLKPLGGPVQPLVLEYTEERFSR
jgi:hypothetical protein